jgi:hypothetical protein
LAKEEVLHDVCEVISLVSFYQSSVILSMSCKPLFLCHVSVVYLCHVDKLSIYVMWSNCLSMSCGQINFLCHVHKLLSFHVDKLFIYIMYTACSLGLSATRQQYFSLRMNQPPATSQQYSSLRTNQHQPSATSQPNRLYCSYLAMMMMTLMKRMRIFF